MKAIEVHKRTARINEPCEDNAWDMMKNTDVCIIINREIDDSTEVERQFMGFKLEKFRGKPNKDKVYVFLHPFDENNGILLPPDIEGKALSRLNMEDFNPLDVNSLNKGGRPDFKDYDTDNDDFMASFVDIISDDYKDSSDNYVDLYKSAEEVSNRMKELAQKEKDLIKRRKSEMKNKNKNHIIKDQRIIIHRKSYIVNDCGYIEIHRIRSIS